MDKKWKVIALWVLPITIVVLITWQILGSATNNKVNQANTSAASIPLAMSCAHKSGKIKKNDILALCAIGGGLTWGSCILKV